MRLGQGCRSRSPWWIWCIAIVSGVAVLPGAEYVTAQSPEAKKTVDGKIVQVQEQNVAQVAAPLPPRSLPLPSTDSDHPLAKEVDLIATDVQIIAVASGTEESKNMFAKLAEHSIFPQEQSVPILSTIPYVGRLFKNQGIQLASATSGVPTRQFQIALLSSDQSTEFIERFLDPDRHTYLSRPQIMTINGNTGHVAVGQFEDERKKVLADGYSLSISPTIIDKDTIRLEYELTISKSEQPKDVGEQLRRDQSAKDLSKSIRKSTQQRTMLQFRLDQTLVIASQQDDVDGPFLIVVVKCSLPYAKLAPVDASEQAK